MHPVQLYCWHFMPYPYLPDDFEANHETGWATAPNTLWDREQARGLYQEYIDQLVYADELGFDGVTLNEHHQTIYGLMPSPNIIAAALTQRTTRAKICVLGNLLPMHANPMRVAEEYAMIDNMSDGRLVAGFAMGSGPEAFTYNVPQPQARARFWEAADLIMRAWRDDGPFEHEGKYFPLRYVSMWPRPVQQPGPEVWIPGGLSTETLHEVAKRGLTYFFSSRSHGKVTQQTVERFSGILEEHGASYHPFRMGILVSLHVGETDEQAREEAEEGIWYFLRNCLKGHLRKAGRQLTFGPGVPSQSVASWEAYLRRSDPNDKMLGDAEDWDELDRFGSIIVGSPETVRNRLWSIIEQAPVGYIQLQFHMGNARPEHVRNSMRLFAEQVAPALRRDSAELFAHRFPALAEEPAP